MTLDIDKGEFFIDDSNSLWAGNSLTRFKTTNLNRRYNDIRY